jgi:hypothetical protein
MANAIKWAAPASIVSVLTTELNSLANNTLSALGPVYDNAANKNRFIDIEVHLGSLTPAAGGYVALYAALAVDGATYGDAKREAMQQVIGVLNLDTAAAVKHTSLRNVPIPPVLMKFYLDNQTGVALAATLNTVKVVSYNEELQ